METAFARLDPGALARPAPGSSWTPGQIVAHLNLTDEPYLPRIRAATERAPQGDLPVRATFLGRLIGRAAGPEGNAPAPRALRPSSTVDAEEALNDWRNNRTEYESILDLAEGRDLVSPRLASPFAPLIRFSLYDVLALIGGHTERHIRQIERAV